MTASTKEPEMTADDVCDFLDQLDAHGIRIWLDGGWAVDAGLGSQTRRHGDLDIVIEERDVPMTVAALRGRGYTPVPRHDTRAWNFVECITPDWLVRFHSGYPVDETDWADVSALCERFGIPMPSESLRFR